MDLGSLIIMVTIVFSMLKITRGLKIFLRNWPLVTKKEGSIRICVDYRNPNDITSKFAFPLPQIDITLDGWSQYSEFGYLQAKMDPEDIDKKDSTMKWLIELVLAELDWRSALSSWMV